MVIRVSDKTQNCSKVTKLLVKPTYLTYQAKGFVNQNRRGISKDKIGIACAIDEDGNYVVHTADRGRPTSSTLIDIFKNTTSWINRNQ